MRVYSDLSPVFQIGSANATASEELRALLGGFVFTMSPPSDGWFATYNARHVFLRFAPTANLEAIETREVYEVSEEQNLTLQKTILGLPQGRSYSVGIEVRDDAGTAAYTSPPRQTTTLTQSEALAISYSE